MRIISGTLGGRPLQSPKHTGLRPTSDKVRQALFNVLTHGACAVSFEGACVIDLFAGTGALGCEAASRGAAYVLFVDTGTEARALIRQHVQDFGLAGMTRIFRRDATDLGQAHQRDRQRYDLAFLDPPYGQTLGEGALAALVAGEWLKPGALVVLEESAKADITWTPDFTVLDTRTYGETQIVIARYATPQDPISGNVNVQ